MAEINVEDLEPGRIEEDPAAARERRRSPLRFIAILVVAIALLFGVPWWTIVLAPGWPVVVTVLGTLVVLAGAVAVPVGMIVGHTRGNDRAAIVGDTALGASWIVFTWSVLANVLGLALLAFGLHDPARSRVVAIAALAVAAVMLAWGHYEAMRVSRVKHLDVVLPRLGAGLDGTRVVMLTDTHYGPIDRARWSRGVGAVVKTLDADVLVHAGDIADGTPEQRRDQAAPLGELDATLAKIYVTGNHEYYSGAQPWLDRMSELGWDCLHNRHLVVERGGDRLVLAGVDDVTAASSGLPGHRTDLPAALAGADPDLPVLLVAHQPKFIFNAAEGGVDLQLSGHTHGGQIWPFHYLVRTDQPAVAGLSKWGERTQLYTSRGTGFWGPPFRVFAPSEITVLTLRSPAA
jgi:predicted MPP superfamily phosphohydrolase